MEADDGHRADPEHVVTVANVGASVAGLLVEELRAAGIHAEMAEQRGVYRGVMRYSIVCFETDQERAIAIIDQTLAKQRD
jgi:hypothetical protein